MTVHGEYDIVYPLAYDGPSYLMYVADEHVILDDADRGDEHGGLGRRVRKGDFTGL